MPQRTPRTSQHLTPDSAEIQSPSRLLATYLTDIDPPGSRHDNDHRDIRSISVLPTAKEIYSRHKEFLPSIDFRQSLFYENPTLRYLDTHFRLLRYDVFGPWKEAIHGLIVSKEEDGLPQFRQREGNVTAYLY